MRKSFLALLAGALVLVLSAGAGASAVGSSAAKAGEPVRGTDNLSFPLAEKQAAARRSKLEKAEGYRIWATKDGRPVFARLTALDANMGTFTGEWGDGFKTFLSRLSEEDQAWIAARRQPSQ